VVEEYRKGAGDSEVEWKKRRNRRRSRRRTNLKKNFKAQT